MTRSRAVKVAVLAFAIPLAACGTDGSGGAGAADDVAETTTGTTTGTTAEGDEGGRWLTSDGDVLITCHGGPAFPASVVEGVGPVEVGQEDADDIVRALAAVKEEAGIDAPGPLLDASAEDVRWLVLWQGSDLSGEDGIGLLLAAPETTDFSLDRDEYLELGQHEGHWRVEGWGGGCRARLALDRASSWAQLAWPEGADQQTGSTITVLVSEIECTSARDPEPFLAAEPVVEETAEDVTVYWTSEAVVGGATCPGNPWVERTVQLESDLGERTLLDGSTWPAKPVSTQEELG